MNKNLQKVVQALQRNPFLEGQVRKEISNAFRELNIEEQGMIIKHVVDSSDHSNFYTDMEKAARLYSGPRSKI